MAALKQRTLCMGEKLADSGREFEVVLKQQVSAGPHKLVHLLRQGLGGWPANAVISQS